MMDMNDIEMMKQAFDRARISYREVPGDGTSYLERSQGRQIKRLVLDTSTWCAVVFDRETGMLIEMEVEE